MFCVHKEPCRPAGVRREVSGLGVTWPAWRYILGAEMAGVSDSPRMEDGSAMAARFLAGASRRTLGRDQARRERS